MEKFLRSNNFARALAVFLAVALWLFVTGDNITRTTPSLKTFREVPVNIENLETGLVIVEMNPLMVDMTLEGLPEAFNGLTVNEMSASVDLSEKRPGSHTLPVNGKPPRGLRLIAIYPEQVEVVIEALHTASFPLDIEFSGTPAAGWVRDSHIYEPSQVRLEAPQSLFGLIDRVVARVNLDGKKELYQAELTPVVLDSRGEELPGVSVIPGLVEISVQFVQISDDSP